MPSAKSRWRGAVLTGLLLSAFYPLLLSGAAPGRDLPATYGGEDPLLQSAILQQTLQQPPLSLENWHAPFHWPGRFSLAYMDPLLGQAILVGWIPGVRGEPAWAYNLAMALTLGLAFLASLYLARSLGLGRASAWLAAIAYVASPYAAAHLQHLNQIPSPWLPLALTGLLLLARRRPQGAAVLGVALLAQLVSGVYYTVALMISVTLVAVLSATAWSRREWLGVIAVALVFGLALWIWSVPYRQAAAVVEGFDRTATQVGPFAARPFDLLHGPRPHLLPWPPFVPGRPPIYPGIGWSLLAGGALWTLWRRPRLATECGDRASRRLLWGLALAAVAGLVLSFGRSLPVPFRESEIGLPLAWLQDHVWPLRALRSPSRLFLPTSLALALFGAWGATLLLRALAARGRVRMGVGVLVLGLALIDLAPGPTGRVRAAPDAPEKAMLAELRTAEGTEPWLAFPQPCREQEETELDARCMLWAALTQQPVAGGSTGFVPRPVHELRGACCGGPEPECLRSLVRAGVRRVLIPASAAPLAAAWAELKHEDERWRLYVLKTVDLGD